MPDNKYDLLECRRPRRIIDVPSSNITIGHTCMHADNKKNDESPQVVYPGQTVVILHFVGYLFRHDFPNSCETSTASNEGSPWRSGFVQQT